MRCPHPQASGDRNAAGPTAALLTVTLLCALVSPAHAAPGELELTAVLQLGAQFVPNRWVPIRVELTNRTDRAVDGFLSMPAANRAAPFVVHQPCHVPAKTRVRLSMLGMFPLPDGTTENRSGKALARIDWYSSAGERLAMSDLFGVAQRDTPSANVGSSALRSTFVLLIGDQRGGATPQPIAAGPLATIGSAWVNVTDAPRQRAAYEGFRFVVLSGVHPDALDLAQRQALLDHLLVGGVLVCPAPDPASAESWLDPYWPVECVGRRPMRSPDGITLRPGTIVTQALARRGEIVLRGAHYVHAAFQRIGLGRVAFTSFPIDALDPTDTASHAIWGPLLGPGAADADWESSQLAADHAQHLDAMLGVATAPWWLAASLVGGYLCVAIAVHLGFTGPRRPAAFALIVVLALASAAALAALSVAGGRNATLAGARLATLDVAAAGGGIYQEELAFVGRDEPSLRLSARHASAELRPVAADAGRAPAVQTDPFAAPEAGARASVVDRVWSAAQPVGVDVRLHAVGTFGPDGLKLLLDNAVGGAVRAPMLLWRETGAVFPLDEIAPGRSADVRPGPRNALDDWGHTAVVTSESAKLRAAILQSASTPSPTFVDDTSDPSPMLAGWLDQASVTASLHISPRPRMRSATLLRVPMELRPSDIGTRVRIDAGFVRVAPSERTMGMPYDERRRQWVATGQIGQWLVGFLPPRQVGKLRPRRVTIACDASAPQHTISLFAGQAATGTPAPNYAGRRVAQWSRPIDRQTLAFEPTPEDIDPDGNVWLLLSVQAVSAEAATVPPQWFLRAIEMTYDEAEVVEKPNVD